MVLKVRSRNETSVMKNGWEDANLFEVKKMGGTEKVGGRRGGRWEEEERERRKM